jgi:hypothetical protein
VSSNVPPLSRSDDLFAGDSSRASQRFAKDIARAKANANLVHPLVAFVIFVFALIAVRNKTVAGCPRPARE